MNLEEAKKRVFEYLNSGKKEIGEGTSVVTDYEETSFGWVFHHNSYEYVYYENEKMKNCFSAPVFVDKDFELVFVTGTRLSAENYIKMYERNRGDLNTFYEESMTLWE